VKRGCDLLDVKHPQISRRLSGRLRGDAAIRQARSYTLEGAGTAKAPEAAYRPAWFDASARAPSESL
jgi:hypothetical protein